MREKICCRKEIQVAAAKAAEERQKKQDPQFRKIDLKERTSTYERYGKAEKCSSFA
jgi:hypothetical protein